VSSLLLDRSGAGSQQVPGPLLRPGLDTVGRPRLPVTWPLVVLFVAFPVWWALGVSAFTWIIVAIPVLASLIWRRRGRVPVAFILWLAFTSWVLLSGLQLHSGTHIVTFSYRLALYAAAGILFVYTYNLPRSSFIDTKILRILTVFWMIVVAGGYLGLLVGSHTFTAPFELLLPHGLRSQPFVRELIQPVFVDTRASGHISHFARPAAPFAYSNSWGGNVAVLTPVAIAAAIAAGRGFRRKLIVFVLIAQIVPMVFSLNRGMFLSLGLGIFYVALRLALRGRAAALMSLLGVLALVIVILVLTPLGHLVVASFASSSHGHSNATRLSASQQALAGARQSPVFGYGEPAQVTGQGQQPPIGSQGQLWMVLYSNGVPAAVFFVGFIVAVLWQTRRARGMAGLWLHTAPLVALPQIVVYGWLPVELQVVMVTTALAYRYCWRTVARPEPGALGRDKTAAGIPRPTGGGLGNGLGPGPPVFRQDARSAVSPDTAMMARGSLVNLVAMVSGAVLTFALTVIVSRWLQPAGTGAFFELIALFTIAYFTLELGANTGLMRWISRARAVGGLAEARRILPIALLPVAVIGVGAAAAIWLTAPELARLCLHGLPGGEGTADIRIIAPLVPLAALSGCLIDATRGFGRTWPYLAIEGLGKPMARIALVVGALVAGLGLHGAAIAWGIPVVGGLMATSVIFAVILRSEVPLTAGPHSARRRPGEQHGALSRHRFRTALHRAVHSARRRERGHREPPVPVEGRRQSLGTEFWRFTAPRACQGIFQVTILWLDILLVGALISRHAAGIYAAVSKLAMVGAFALEGTRLAIQPQVSALLARREPQRAAALYQTTTRWLMLASWPMYLVFAIFPAVVLGIFGSRYTPGAAALAVLSLAMLVNLGTGNVTVVLLMGGKSSWGAINTGAALIVNIGLNLLLLPHIGILGAAIAWGASIVVDNVAALIELRWALGLTVFGPRYGLVVAVTAGCFGVVGILARALLGQTLSALAVTLVLGSAAYAAVLYQTRTPLQLAGMTAALQARAMPPAASRPQQAAPVTTGGLSDIRQGEHL
jgi:O-antigen/teichoic acid export membrane protein